MQTYILGEFPTATVAIGDFTHNDYKKVFQLLVQVEEISSGSNGNHHQESEANPHQQENEAASVLALETARETFPVASILLKILDAAEEFYNKAQTIDEQIRSTHFAGKMKALKVNLENLQNSGTEAEQILSETATAISHLQELLQFFADDSILRVKYWIGSPLFVNFCAILKWISLVAEGMPKYNASGLQGLKNEYQEVLVFFRNRCIASRMASCFLTTKTVGVKTWDWTRHAKTKNKYYGNNPNFKYDDYKTDLGGKGWLCDFKVAKYYIVDTWDRRTEVGVESETLKIASNHELSSKEFRKDLLKEYRDRVEAVMLEYFNKVSPGGT